MRVAPVLATRSAGERSRTGSECSHSHALRSAMAVAVSISINHPPTSEANTSMHGVGNAAPGSSYCRMSFATLGSLAVEIARVRIKIARSFFFSGCVTFAARWYHPAN